MTLTLRRFSSTDEGTFGRLFGYGLTLYTLELPWRDNAPDVSCIPAGKYETAWSYSQRFKRAMYEVLGVPQRAGIRIHAGNFAGDVSKGYKAHSNGCPLVGEKLGVIGGQRALLLSQPAIRRFEKHVAQRPFLLVIQYA